MDSIFEEHRGKHEERERIENCMVRELIAKRNSVCVVKLYLVKLMI